MVVVFVLIFDFAFVLIFDFVFVFEKKEACCQPLHLLYARGGKDARGRAGGSATQMHSLGPPRCIVLYLYLYCIVLYCIVLLCIPSVLGDASKRIFHALKRFGMCQTERRKGNLYLVCKHAFDQVNIIRHVV